MSSVQRKPKWEFSPQPRAVVSNPILLFSVTLAALIRPAHCRLMRHSWFYRSALLSGPLWWLTFVMGHQWLYLPLGKVIKKKQQLEIPAITHDKSRKCANCFVEWRLFSSSGRLELFLVLPFVLLSSSLRSFLLSFILSFLCLTPHLNWLPVNG